MAATLKKGSKGDNVKKLQSWLNELGMGRMRGSCPLFSNSREFYGEGKPLNVDGIFGPLTEAMVKSFQKMAGGLDVDGKVGPKTQEAMANWGLRL